MEQIQEEKNLTITEWGEAKPKLEEILKTSGAGTIINLNFDSKQALRLIVGFINNYFNTYNYIFQDRDYEHIINEQELNYRLMRIK